MTNNLSTEFRHHHHGCYQTRIDKKIQACAYFSLPAVLQVMQNALISALFASSWCEVLTFVPHNRLDKDLASSKKLHVSMALILILIYDQMHFLDCIYYAVVELTALTSRTLVGLWIARYVLYRPHCYSDCMSCRF